MIIELAGASGVGKTTCLSYIKNALLSDFNVISSSLLDDKIAEIKKNHDALHFSTIADKNTIFNSPDFISHYMRSVSQMSAADSQKIKLLHFIDSHRQNYLIRNEVKATHLLVEEGLVHASFPISQFSNNIVEDIEWFFSNIPLPDLVIQLHASPDLILERIKSRGKIVNSYLYASDDTILKKLSKVNLYLSEMEKNLTRRDCKVKHVNANSSIDDCSSKIFKIIKEEVTLGDLHSPLTFDFTSSGLSEPCNLVEGRHSFQLADEPLELTFY